MESTDDNFASQIVSLVRNEIDKSENQKRIKQCVIDPILIYALQSILPYIVIVIIFLLLLLFGQGYTIYKLRST